MGLKSVAAGPRDSTSTPRAPDPLAAELARDLDGSFERLVREYQDRLFSFACRLTGRPEDAEEVTQDAFVRSYRALRSYPADRIRALALKAWLYRITLNTARNRLRGKHPRFVPLETWPGEDDPGSRPDAQLARRRERADLATLVAGLPERYRNAIVLRYVEGLRVDEVATILKQPLGTTKSNLHRAVNALRDAITQSRRARR
jgi:RNA polymerase sigma-70 factor (ECF subfamily)